MASKSVYRVSYYDSGGNIAHTNILATDAASAAAFTGASHTVNVTEVAANVEIIGVDSPHARVAAQPATLTPLMPGWGLTREEVSAIKTVLGKPS
jgi:hypothetical protein